MIATLGMFGCDSEHENTGNCDETFVNTCEGTKYQRRCGKNHMTYLQECSLGCITDGSGKSICQGEPLCATPCDTGYYCDYDTCKPIGTNPIPGPGPGPQPECTTNDQCTDGKVCTNNHCVDPGTVPECTTNDDCKDGKVCDGGECKDSGDVPECEKDSDCGENEICDNEVCVEAVECADTEYPRCNADNTASLSCVDGFEHTVACGTGESCADGVCVCQEEAKKCSDSGIPMVCSGGGWVEGTACDEGFTCKNGECKENAGPGPGPDDPEPTACGALTIEDTSNACEIKGSGSTIVLRGTVLGLDETYEGGMVVVENGKITYVGCGDSSIDLDSATVITCPDSVISPGLINAHDHITYDNQAPGVWNDERFDHRHDWRKGKNGHTELDTPQTNSGLDTSVGEMRQLLMGTTAIFGSGNATGLVPSIDKNGIGGFKSAYQTFPLGDSGGTTHDSGCSYSYNKNIDSDSQGFYGPHIGEGINLGALNELHCLSGEGDGAKDIFTDKLAIIHGVAADVTMIAKMAEKGSKLIWSPRSNVSLYGDTAMVPLYDRLGVTIALGTDWTPSGSINTVRELQCADFLNTYYFDRHFSDYDLWRMATYNGAVAFGLTSVVGKLDKGLQADIVMFKTSETKKDHRAVIDADPQDVLLVMMNGKVIYGEENVVTSTNNCESIDVCGSAKRICTADVGAKGTYAEIKAAAKYDLFFCGTPDNEPTCIPMRIRDKDTISNGNGTSQYGVQSYQNNAYYSDPDDIDGDGIPNAKDNCPTMFNPVRPQYVPATIELDDEQPDTDGDGMGDICDPYPTCADNDDTCPVFNPNDSDSDGVDNDKDNCPNTANPDQADKDGDGIGDLCDACPDDGNNEDGKGCTLPVTGIQDIRNAHIAGTLGSDAVKTRGVVTAIANKFDGTSKTGFFIQDETKPAGLLVYSATEAAKVKVGDLVEVRGDIDIYYSLVEIKPESVTVVSSGHTIEPITLTAAQTTQDVTETATKNPYDSVLVTVSGLTVDKYDTTIEKGETYLCKDESDNVAYIDDYVMGKAALDEVVEAGTTYDVTGILVYDYKRSKIAPRSADDLFAGFGMKSLVASAASADWGTDVEVTLTMTQAAAADTTVAIACGNAECPASVAIAAGESSVTFNVTMADSGDTTVKATYEGKDKSVTITGMDPAVELAIASFTPDMVSVAAGKSKIVTVSLNRPAKNAATLNISTDAPFLTVPESVAIAMGDESVEFIVTAADTAMLNDTANISIDIDGGTATTIPVKIVNAGWDFTEKFESVESKTAYATSGSIVTDDYTIDYVCRTDVDVHGIEEKGVILTTRKSYENKLIISGFNGGVGTVAFDWQNWNGTDKGTLEITVGSNTQTLVYEGSTTVDTAEFIFNDATATTIEIKPVYEEATSNTGRIIIDNLRWTTN